MSETKSNYFKGLNDVVHGERNSPCSSVMNSSGNKTTDLQRNLNPHAEAVFAMNLWHNEYAEQHGGVMDFWDTLNDSQKRQCRDTVNKLKELRRWKHDKN